jgi:hypothetical protein
VLLLQQVVLTHQPQTLPPLPARRILQPVSTSDGVSMSGNVNLRLFLSCYLAITGYWTTKLITTHSFLVPRLKSHGIVCFQGVSDYNVTSPACFKYAPPPYLYFSSCLCVFAGSASARIGCPTSPCVARPRTRWVSPSCSACLPLRPPTHVSVAMQRPSQGNGHR